MALATAGDEGTGLLLLSDHSPRRRRLPGRADGLGPGGHRAAGHVGGSPGWATCGGNVVVAVVRVRVAWAPAPAS